MGYVCCCIHNSDSRLRKKKKICSIQESIYSSSNWLQVDRRCLISLQFRISILSFLYLCLLVHFLSVFSYGISCIIYFLIWVRFLELRSRNLSFCLFGRYLSHGNLSLNYVIFLRLLSSHWAVIWNKACLDIISNLSENYSLGSSRGYHWDRYFFWIFLGCRSVASKGHEESTRPFYFAWGTISHRLVFVTCARIISLSLFCCWKCSVKWFRWRVLNKWWRGSSKDQLRFLSVFRRLLCFWLWLLPSEESDINYRYRWHRCRHENCFCGWQNGWPHHFFRSSIYAIYSCLGSEV